LKNQKTFYTDANGLSMQKRILDFRPTWKTFYAFEHAAANYYPINSCIKIKDGSKELVVLNDRTQGGSSLQEGQIEIMIHRRILIDDLRGMGEPLNETDSYDDKGMRATLRHTVSFTSD